MLFSYYLDIFGLIVFFLYFWIWELLYHRFCIINSFQSVFRVHIRNVISVHEMITIACFAPMRELRVVAENISFNHYRYNFSEYLSYLQTLVISNRLHQQHIEIRSAKWKHFYVGPSECMLTFLFVFLTCTLKKVMQEDALRNSIFSRTFLFNLKSYPEKS